VTDSERLDAILAALVRIQAILLAIWDQPKSDVDKKVTKQLPK